MQISLYDLRVLSASLEKHIFGCILRWRRWPFHLNTFTSDTYMDFGKINICIYIYLYFLNILYFFNYSCTNIFHRRSLYTFYIYTSWRVLLSIGLCNNFQWHMNQNTPVFIHENVFENVICKTVAIAPGRYVLQAFAMHRMSACLSDKYVCCCIEAETKWLPFCRRYFQMHFLESKFWI